MRKSRDKKAGTIRFEPATKATLEFVSGLVSKSESAIVDDALIDWFKKHGFDAPNYTMKASNTVYSLLRQYGSQAEVIDQQIRNGVPLEEIRQNYSVKYKSPVALVIDAGEA